MAKQTSNIEGAPTRRSWAKIIVFVLLLVFYASILIHKIELPTADDIARHVKNGEIILNGQLDVLKSNVYSYTAPENSFINHHWLSGVFFFLLHQAVGWPGLIMFKVVILLTAFSLLFVTATKKADFWLVAFSSIPAIVVLGERSALRPEIFSYLLVAAFLYLLIDLEEHPERKRVFWLIPLQILWVNTHLFFIIGPLLTAGFLLEKIILNRGELKGNPLIKKLVYLLLAQLAALFVNPNFIAGALYPLQIFQNFGVEVAETRSVAQFLREEPAWSSIPVALFQPLVLLLAASYIFALRSKRIFYFLASVATAVVGFRVFRTIPFFGMIFLPTISANLDGVFTQFHEKTRRATRVVLVVMLAGFLSWLIFLGSRGKVAQFSEPGIGLTKGANNSGEFFKQNGLRGPIFNDFDIGSYLIYHFYPDEQVFVDNRPEAYSVSFFEEVYQPALREESKWQGLLGQYQFDAIFLHLYSQNPSIRPFMYRRFTDPEWALVYADRYAIIFLRNNAENQAVISDFQITLKNAPERLIHLIDSPTLEDQVAAADVLSLLRLEDAALMVFQKAAAQWPVRGRTWKAMGELALLYIDDPDPTLAAEYLEKAAAAGEKSDEVYWMLGLAYYQTGDFPSAAEALQRALEINPDRRDARELLEEIARNNQN